MKKGLWILLILLWTLQVNAQVSMTVQLPSAGVLQKAQLWNILLVSASNTPVSVRIVMRLSDAATNQPVLTGVSRTVVLGRGAKQLQLSEVSPVQYEYLSAAVDRDVNGLLSAGNYLACYSVIIEGEKMGELTSEDCVPFTVEPISPPLLNSPADQSVLDMRLPQFTWLPPSPVSIYNDLNYELILAEVRPGQSALEAIQQNMPMFRSPHNRNLFMNYPASAVALDTAKQYAWTIIAKNGNEFSAQTEVWTFKINSKQVNNTVFENAYVQLKKEVDGAVASSSAQLRCSYTNEANDNTAKYEVISLDKGGLIVTTGNVPLKPGENLLEISIRKVAGLETGKSYQLRLLNSRNEYWNMKFIYSGPVQQ
jgi:hypothetical protein